MLGVLAHQVGRNDIAVDLIAKAIAINGNVAAYHSNRALALRALGRLDEALGSLGAALRLQPDYPEAQLNSGAILRDIDRPDDALASYEAALHLKPDYAEAHSSRGAVLRILGRLDQAAASHRAAIVLKPDYAEAYCSRGNMLGDLGDIDGALASYIAALRIRPDYAEAHYNRGVAAHELGQLDAALASYNSALCLKPDNAEAYYSRGQALNDMGRLDDAVASCDAALRIAPSYAEAHFSRGNALKALGHLDDAVACYDAALRLKPGYHEACLNLGNALTDLGRFDEALASFDAALHLNPDFPEPYCNRGVTLHRLGRIHDALASYDAALCLKPDYAKAQSNRGQALQDLGRLEAALASHEIALRLKPDFPEAHSNRLMSLHYSGRATAEAILAAARAYGATFDQEDPARKFANAADGERRLRIGYVSGDFGRHPVGYFLARVLENHRRSEVEIFCYGSARRDDDLTARLRAAADHWRSIVGQSDDRAADQVRADGIDILVDLAGHTAYNRLPLFARRPAPVQASWLGYWGTTGLAAMDYVLSDEITVRRGEEAYFTERVLRLPVSRFCYDPPNYAPPPSRRGGTLTFGSFNNLAKVGPEAVALWAAVLRAVPDAKLLLKWKSLADQRLRDRLTADFGTAGVDADRLILRAASPHAEMLAEYGDVDIALDPFPFSGGLTSCEALWMGVPVVTLPGTAAPSRQTLGFLAALGLTGWAATDAADYVRIAAGLAADRAGLESIRATLRTRMAASRLCDGAVFTRDLENAFRTMWRNWCRQSRQDGQ
jgi:protein O-GlcNAc transferase